MSTVRDLGSLTPSRVEVLVDTLDPFSELESLGVKRVDILLLLLWVRLIDTLDLLQYRPSPTC